MFTPLVQCAEILVILVILVIPTLLLVICILERRRVGMYCTKVQKLPYDLSRNAKLSKDIHAPIERRGQLQSSRFFETRRQNRVFSPFYPLGNGLSALFWTLGSLMDKVWYKTLSITDARRFGKNQVLKLVKSLWLRTGHTGLAFPGSKRSADSPFLSGFAFLRK